MRELFCQILQLSIYGGLMISAIMLLRPVLSKAPRRISCLIWLLVCLRLMVPFQVRSAVSLQPDLDTVLGESVVQQETPPEEMEDVVFDDGLLQDPPTQEDPQIAAPQPSTPVTQPSVSAPVVDTPPQQGSDSQSDVDYMTVLAWVWVAGMAALLIYGLGSYARLKSRVRDSVIASEGVWSCARIHTAFVLGFFRPQVYLPAGLSEDQRMLILSHERIHVKYWDHWCKPLAFLTLAVHWFNPLVLLAFVLLCRDMEMACDEAVIQSMTLQQRKDYSAALLSCSCREHSISVCPVAFGEISVKRRIKNVLSYRKKNLWIILAAVLATLTLAACFLTDPMASVSQPPETEPSQTEPGPTESEPTEGEETILPSKPEELLVTYQDYQCRYEGRDGQWEEDVAVAAREVLANFLPFKDQYVLQLFSKTGAYMYVNTNDYYDKDMRVAFLQEIENLINRIPELTDAEITFELRKILTMDEGRGAWISWAAQQAFPLKVEELEHQGELGLYVVRTSQEHPELLYKRLTKINGIPIDQIIEQLRPYAQANTAYESDLFIRKYDLKNLEALQVIGIVEAGIDYADFSFADDSGTEITVTLYAQDSSTLRETGIWEDFKTRKITLHAQDGAYWCQTLAGGQVYARISSCFEDEEYPTATFFADVLEQMKTQTQPATLILDLRENEGGKYPLDGLQSFLNELYAVKPEHVYVLIDHGTNGAAGMLAFLMMRYNLPLEFVGLPAGCAPEGYGDNLLFTLPNSGLKLGVTTKYFVIRANYPYEALMADTIVYQSLSDYQQGIDTVLEYVCDSAD